MVYLHTAIVEVTRLAFPFDMLRYDSCHPATQEDVASLTHVVSRYARHEPAEPIRIKLHAISKNREHWTVDRWASFGVKCIRQPSTQL